MCTVLGFSSNTDARDYSVKDESKKLTIEQMNRYARLPATNVHAVAILMTASYDMVKDVEGKLGFIADTDGLPN